MSDADLVLVAARALTVRPRERRWAHLGLCVLDAVFSIGARYATTVRTCHTYAEHRDLEPYDPADREQPVAAFLEDVDAAGPERFAADVLRNRQRTSPRGGVLKAEAARQYAAALVAAGVGTRADLAELVTDPARSERLEGALRRVPGNGASDVRLGYFRMLTGDDRTIKPDRMLLRWLQSALGRPVGTDEARALVAGAAAELGCTPWELDRAIWSAQRARRPAVTSDSALVRRYRAHQGRWREEVLGLPAGHALNGRAEAVDSMLPEDHGERNLMSDAAVAYARERVPAVKAAGGVVEHHRLHRNLLSSQPLAFSLVGELRAHPDAALAVLSELSGRPLAGFGRITGADDRFALDGLQAEWAPNPAEHTRDRSGFDIAAALRTRDGRGLLLTVEVKYTDDFSRATIDPRRYRQHLDALGISDGIVSRLGPRRAQFLRSVLLTASVQRAGLADDVLAVVLSRDDDTTAREVVDAVGAAVPAVPTAWWGLSRFLDAAGRHEDLADWADAVAARYLLPDHGA